jgi:hypothetical protein
MAINFGTELALAIHTDSALTYGNVESALVDAEFTNYTIIRNVNSDGSADFQLYVRAEQTGGTEQFLDAADTLTNLGEAIAAMESDMSA